jgi:hypothetical protein
MKGQISVEFLMIIGILSIAMLPVMFAMHWTSQETPDKVAIAKASFSGSRLASSVNSIGNLGTGSAIVAQVELPVVESISLGRREININVLTSFGEVAIVQATDFEIEQTGFDRIGAEGTYLIDMKVDQDGVVQMRLKD